MPFDLATILTSVEKTHRVVIADETHQSCGVAAEIAARIAETGFDKLKTPHSPRLDPGCARALQPAARSAHRPIRIAHHGRGSRRRWRKTQLRVWVSSLVFIGVIASSRPSVSFRPKGEISLRFLSQAPVDLGIVSLVESARGNSLTRSSPMAKKTASDSVELLRRMWLIRAFEEKASALYAERQIVGLLHLSIGQEAVAAGVCGLLRNYTISCTAVIVPTATPSPKGLTSTALWRRSPGVPRATAAAKAARCTSSQKKPASSLRQA